MSKHIIRTGTIALTSAAVLALGAGAAGASTSSTDGPTVMATLQEIQAKAGAAISDRVSGINAAVAKVDADTKLGSDAAGLVTYLQRDVTPLEALSHQIDADTTLDQAEADFADIFSDYRVDALVLPGADLATHADDITVTAIPALTAFSQQAQSRVTPANQATLTPLVSSLTRDISGATSATSGVANTVLSDTPYDWNQNHSLLSSAKTSITTAAGDITSAELEAKQIRQVLKQSHPAVTTPSSSPKAAS